MQNLINDMESGDTMEPKHAQNFLKSLFEELKIPLTNKEIKEIVEQCIDSEKQILKTELKSKIIQSLPPGKLNTNCVQWYPLKLIFFRSFNEFSAIKKKRNSN